MMWYVWLNRCRVFLALVLAGWGLVAPAQLPSAGVVTGFRVPDFDTNGVLKSEIFGDQAQPQPGTDLVKITGLRIVLYKNKEVESTLTSEHCTVNRKDRSAFSNAEVRIVRGNIVITGRGFRWNPDSQRIEILNRFHMIMAGTVKVWPLVKENK
jgi:lipopolysaccharide export system protein LptC